MLALAFAAGRYQVFGHASRYVETVGYSLKFFFHMIPGVTETSTRLPPGAPLAANPDVPGLQMVVGALFVLFLIGASLQVRRMRGAGTAGAGRAPAGSAG